VDTCIITPVYMWITNKYKLLFMVYSVCLGFPKEPSRREIHGFVLFFICLLSCTFIDCLVDIAAAEAVGIAAVAAVDIAAVAAVDIAAVAAVGIAAVVLESQPAPSSQRRESFPPAWPIECRHTLLV